MVNVHYQLIIPHYVQMRTLDIREWMTFWRL